MDKAEQVQLEVRLDNWGAWARSGLGGGAGRCGSAEGRYIREKADEERFEKSARVPIDMLDAEAVEKGLLALGDWRDRDVLRDWYCWRKDEKQIAAKLHMRPFMVNPARIKALAALQYRLDISRMSGYCRKGLSSNKYEGHPTKASPAP